MEGLVIALQAQSWEGETGVQPLIQAVCVRGFCSELKSSPCERGGWVGGRWRGDLT